MTQAEQRPDENSSAAQAEIERLKQELSRSTRYASAGAG